MTNKNKPFSLHQLFFFYYFFEAQPAIFFDSWLLFLPFSQSQPCSFIPTSSLPQGLSESGIVQPQALPTEPLLAVPASRTCTGTLQLLLSKKQFQETDLWYNICITFPFLTFLMKWVISMSTHSRKQNSLLNEGLYQFTYVSYWSAGSIEGTLPLPPNTNILLWKHTQCWHKPDSSRDGNPIFCWMDSAPTTTLKSLHNVFFGQYESSVLYRKSIQRGEKSFHSQLYHESVPSSQVLISFWANPRNININNIRIHKTLCFRNFVPEEIIHRWKNRIRAILNNTAAETNDDVSTWAATKLWKHQEFAGTYLCSSKASKLFANLLLIWGGLISKTARSETHTYLLPESVKKHSP